MSGPFRDDEPHGHSPTLARLATRSRDAGDITAIEREPASARAIQLGEALGESTPIGCLAAVGWIGAAGLVLLWLLDEVPTAWLWGAGALAVSGQAAHLISWWSWRRTVARRLAWTEQRPFPITGVRGYLVSGRAMIDVTFVQVPLAAEVTRGFRGHAPDASVAQIDERTFRVILRGEAEQQQTALVDDAELRRFVDDVLVPVHEETGIEKVVLGGLPLLKAGETRQASKP